MDLKMLNHLSKYLPFLQPTGSTWDFRALWWWRLNYCLNFLTSTPSVLAVFCSFFNFGLILRPFQKSFLYSFQDNLCYHLSYRTMRKILFIYSTYCNLLLYIYCLILSFSAQVCKVHSDMDHSSFIHPYLPSTSLAQRKSQYISVEWLQVHLVSW